MAKKMDELLDHDYDGIQEYDNPLPPWWLMLFYITIIFSVVYLPYYHMFGGPGSADEYQAEVKMWADKAPKQEAVAAPVVAAVPENVDALAEGKKVWDKICFSCHKPDGGGLIGPNLTDKFWIHGKGALEDIVAVVTTGVPAKGMPPMGGLSLTPEEITYVSKFVISLQGTNPAGAKEAQGNPVE